MPSGPGAAGQPPKKCHEIRLALANASAIPGGTAVMIQTPEQTATELEQLVLSRLAEFGIPGEFRSVHRDEGISTLPCPRRRLIRGRAPSGPGRGGSAESEGSPQCSGAVVPSCD